MTYGIRIVGLQQVQRALGADFKLATQNACFGIAVAVQGELATPPGPVKLPLRFASAKQRGWFIKKYLPSRKKRGLGRWKRESDPDSQALLKSWSVARRGAVGAIVSTRATYAPWVQSAQYQQPMHKATGWPTDRDAIRKVVESGDAKRLGLQAIVAKIKRRA